MTAFIDDHRGVYGVEPICRVLPIAPSTYHAHAARRTDPGRLPARARSDAALMVEIRRVSDRVVVISDGRSIAEVPAAVLDEETLTLLAAPRSSMQKNVGILRELTASHGGAAFWALLEAGRVFCLDCVVGDPAADPDFRAGETPEFAASSIPVALQALRDGFVAEACNGRATLLTPVRSHRGHNLGWIGLTLAATPPPEPAPIRQLIQTRFAAA